MKHCESDPDMNTSGFESRTQRSEVKMFYPSTKRTARSVIEKPPFETYVTMVTMKYVLVHMI